MMGMRMPETCWAVFKRQAVNLRDWCIWLVDLFENICLLKLIFLVVRKRKHSYKHFEGAFAKLRKTTISLVIFVRPTAYNSALSNQISVKIDIWVFFETLFEKIQVLKSDKSKVEDRYIFLVPSRSVHLRIKNFSDKSSRETRNTHFMFNIFFFRKSCRLWDHAEKVFRAV